MHLKGSTWIVLVQHQWGGDKCHKEDECERIGYGLVKGVKKGVEYVRVMNEDIRAIKGSVRGVRVMNEGG